MRRLSRYCRGRAIQSPLTKKSLFRQRYLCGTPLSVYICYVLSANVAGGVTQSDDVRRGLGSERRPQMDSLFGVGGSLTRALRHRVRHRARPDRRRHSGSCAASAATRVGAAAQRGRQPRLAVIDAAAGRRTPPARAGPPRQRRASADDRRPERHRGRNRTSCAPSPVTAPRDVPVPRTGAPEGGAGAHHRRSRAAARATNGRRPSPRRVRRFARPDAARTRAARRAGPRPPRRAEPRPLRAAGPPAASGRASRRLPPARSSPRRAAPRAQPQPRTPALASMAQRLEAALRRPGEPRAGDAAAGTPISRSMRRPPRPRTASRRRTQSPPHGAERLGREVQIRARQPRRGNGEPARPSAREAIAPPPVHAYRSAN